ncbi:MAG: hypothetical protein V7711_16105 [Pseudomonadales bacterium]
MLSDAIFYQNGIQPSAIEKPLVYILGATLIVLCLLFIKARRGITTYRADLAWLRAGIYFCVALLISKFTGVLSTLLQTPVVTEAQLSNWLWWAFTGFWVLQVFIAYTFIWPRGTFTEGRKLEPIPITFFGIMWGLCHAQMFLVVWALVEYTGLGTLWVAIISFNVISFLNLQWQLRFWDVHISPQHNIEEWNNKKVLMCHVPNLLLGFIHLALFGNIAIFVALQTYALMVSAINMHFPAWWDKTAGQTQES